MLEKERKGTKRMKAHGILKAFAFQQRNKYKAHKGATQTILNGKDTRLFNYLTQSARDQWINESPLHWPVEHQDRASLHQFKRPAWLQLSDRLLFVANLRQSQCLNRTHL